MRITAYISDNLFSLKSYFEFDDWRIDLITKQVYIDVEDDIMINDLWEKVNKLRIFLIALFLEDLEPRTIVGFNYEAEINFKSPSFYSVLGNSMSLDDKLISNLSGWVLNYKRDGELLEINKDQVLKNYDFLNMEKGFARNLGTFMDSVIIINKFHNTFDYKNPNDLFTGILLLVSSLEGFFLQGQRNKVSSKFSLIGSLYYEKYADVEFLNQFEFSSVKYDYKTFKSILKKFYDVRSNFAHGDYDIFSKENIKVWKKLLNHSRTNWQEENGIPSSYKTMAFALGLLQKHIIAIFKGAGKDILLGPEIINKIKID